ncbi:shikimate kinase [Lutibacter sp. TH_r2]|uniref:shikimate kinase n=1 Tax=Lutibacter sp. TH_r2 TaxID=3082083 RepID=UPI0029552885|nr:shikimate kinase [Lutibacter sp. TH_r2]MDV7188334.1 shikimate kinase [Lutibacter sp. TH_r2]
MKIVLLGYMASGKSAVGKVVAKKMLIPFIDLDAYIEAKEQSTISTIFKEKGEIYFRNKESECLKELLSSKNDMIISLGGGTPCYGNNMELITENSTSIYLKASINTIFERIKKETLQRPLVATIGIDNLKEFIAKHLFERSPFYESASKIANVDDKSILEISEEIITLL